MQTTSSRMRVFVHGLVQGIGFRPYVFNLATRFHLSGFVRNNSAVVEIEVEGFDVDIASFLKELPKRAPVLARISKIETQVCDPQGETANFKIEVSSNEQTAERHVPNDTATCPECLNELFSPSNRRYQYPFINCINCGPRFTIIESLPYDRASTTMKRFEMCQVCKREYEDPTNRRFHAQPNACPKCGPNLSFRSPLTVANPQDDRCSSVPLILGRDALGVARDALLQGQVIAVKGLGGYHLMGDARKSEVVEKIRAMKAREARPLAVMFSNVDDVEAHCLLSDAERKLLEGQERPIVLLRRREGVPKNIEINSDVAPGLDEIGAMLPYTPLHHLLVRLCDFPLVATSANDQGLPIITSDAEALSKFDSCGVLFHNREIYSGYDDSIQRVVGGGAVVLRRARGLAPAQIDLPFESKRAVLAVGAHLKNTFCLAKNTFARISQHLGDIDTIERLENYKRTLCLYENLFDIHPQAIIHDLHPNYQTTFLAESLAKERELPLIGVQHHHAHAVSVMAEHNISKALAVVFDGIGMGSDGHFWGGEFLLAEYDKFQRLAQFQNVPMPGAEAAIKNPWRMALGILAQGDLIANESVFASFVKRLRDLYGAKEVSTVTTQTEKKLNTPLTSSCGRLFDAAAALISPEVRVTYEGQAAMQLEALARRCNCARNEFFEYELLDGELCTINALPILIALQKALMNGLPKECAARAFHESIIQIVLDVLRRLRAQTSISAVCLSGGVFQNALLSASLKTLLLQDDFLPLFPQQLPVNDGGLSYGQAVIGLTKLENGLLHTNEVAL